MAAVEITIIQPVVNALTTPEGWIGLLLGLGGRETLRGLNRIRKAIQGERNAE